MVIPIESPIPSFILGIGVGVIGLMSGIISLFLMAPHAEYIRPRLLRRIVRFVYFSILLFLTGVLLSITFFILYTGVGGIELTLSMQLLAQFTLYIDLIGWIFLSFGVIALYREWIEGSAELRLKLREKETEIETKAGTGLGIPKPDEIPPFVVDELRKDIKTINQRLEDLGIPAGVIKEVKPRKGIPETLKQEIELIQAKIELTRDFYGLEKPVWYFMKLGNFYFESKDYEKAIEQYKEVLEKEPENANALFNRGRAYEEKGYHDKAIEDYDIYLEKINPSEAAAYNNRGLAYDELKQHERAIDDYNKAIELDPNNGTAYSNRGLAYGGLKQHERAIDDYNKAIELDPNDETAYSNRGSAYRKLKRYEKAIEDHNKALELNPEYAGAYGNRGNVYYDKGNYERAIEDYNKVLEINPGDIKAYLNRGVAYRKLKQHAKEQEDYKKALELDPNHVEAMLNFSESYIITKNYVYAHEMADRALNIAEESKDIIIAHFLMVCSSMFQNKKEDAKSQLNRLIEYLEKIKDWTLTWDFSDIKQAMESSDVDENAKSLMLSLIELLENKITVDEFKHNFVAQ